MGYTPHDHQPLNLGVPYFQANPNELLTNQKGGSTSRSRDLRGSKAQINSVTSLFSKRSKDL